MDEDKKQEIERIQHELDELNHRSRTSDFLRRLHLPAWFYRIPWRTFFIRRWGLFVILLLIIFFVNGIHAVYEGTYHKGDKEKEQQLLNSIQGPEDQVEILVAQLSDLKKENRRSYLEIIRQVDSVAIVARGQEYEGCKSSSPCLDERQYVIGQLPEGVSIIGFDDQMDKYYLLSLLVDVGVQKFKEMPLYQKMYIVLFSANPVFHPFNWSYAKMYEGFPHIEDYAGTYVAGLITREPIGKSYKIVAGGISEFVKTSPGYYLGFSGAMTNLKSNADFWAYPNGILKYQKELFLYTFYHMFLEPVCRGGCNIIPYDRYAWVADSELFGQISNMPLGFVKLFVFRLSPLILLVLLFIYWPRTARRWLARWGR